MDLILDVRVVVRVRCAKLLLALCMTVGFGEVDLEWEEEQHIWRMPKRFI